MTRGASTWTGRESLRYSDHDSSYDLWAYQPSSVYYNGHFILNRPADLKSYADCHRPIHLRHSLFSFTDGCWLSRTSWRRPALCYQRSHRPASVTHWEESASYSVQRCWAGPPLLSPWRSKFIGCLRTGSHVSSTVSSLTVGIKSQHRRYCSLNGLRHFHGSPGTSTESHRLQTSWSRQSYTEEQRRPRSSRSVSRQSYHWEGLGGICHWNWSSWHGAVARPSSSACCPGQLPVACGPSRICIKKRADCPGWSVAASSLISYKTYDSVSY